MALEQLTRHEQQATYGSETGLSREPYKRNQLLELFPEQASRSLVEKGKIVELKRGQMLRQAGEEIDCVYFPLSGMISLAAVLPDGKSIEVASVGRRVALGLDSVLGLETAVTQAVVLIRGRALRVPTRVLAVLAESNKSVSSLVASYWGAFVAQLTGAVVYTAFHDSQARFCRFLLQARDCVGGATLPLTQEMISEALGVRRPTVTLIAGTLQSEGIISCQRGAVEICDDAAIEKLACPCRH